MNMKSVTLLTLSTLKPVRNSDKSINNKDIPRLGTLLTLNSASKQMYSLNPRVAGGNTSPRWVLVLLSFLVTAPFQVEGVKSPKVTSKLESRRYHKVHCNVLKL
jgi:hypothetical protein